MFILKSNSIILAMIISLFSTYAIAGKAETGIICINGAACHKAKIGDKIIICSYTELESNEIQNHKPTIIYVDTDNRITDKQTNTTVKLA